MRFYITLCETLFSSLQRQCVQLTDVASFNQEPESDSSLYEESSNVHFRFARISFECSYTLIRPSLGITMSLTEPHVSWDSSSSPNSYLCGKIEVYSPKDYVSHYFCSYTAVKVSNT
ncbi:hypothetical protein J6590_038956 [Homalodisca vitripennis]|nr:hypothetical protein J6590_038956 [Homalodisca vitripennis]